MLYSSLAKGIQIQSDSSLILTIQKPYFSDSLLVQYQTATSDSVKFYTLVILALNNDLSGEKRIEYLEKATQLKNEKDKLGMGLYYLAQTSNANEYNEVDSFMQKALILLEEVNQNNLRALVKLNAAISINDIGENYVKGFSLINQFLAEYKVKTDSISWGRAWNGLGEIYRFLQNNTIALDCYKQAQKFSLRQGEIYYRSPFINIGTIYKNLGYYDSALFFYDKVLSVDDTEGSPKYYIFNRKAQIYLLKKEYSLAIHFSESSLKGYKKIKRDHGIILASSTLSIIYYELANYKQAIQHGEVAVNLGLRVNFYPEELHESCRLTALSFYEMQQYEKAFLYQKHYSEIRDKIFGPKVNLEMFNEQLKLEKANQQLQNELFLGKEQQAIEKIKSQRKVNISIIIVLGLSLLLSTILFNKNKTIERLNKKLTENQEEILAQADELRATNEEIESINSNLENIITERTQKIIKQNEKLRDFAYFNSHKVRGPLARILGLIYVFKMDPEKLSTKEYSEMLETAGKDLENSIKEINDILESDEEIQ